MSVLVAVNPHDETVIREAKALSPEEARAEVERAAAAFPVWRETSFADRAALLTSVARRMHDEIDTLAALMTEEMGKPMREARAEVKKSAWCAEHYAEHAAAYLAPEPVASDAGTSQVTYPPLGTILGILPWNAPFWLAFRFLAPTLMAGNTCVIKHDPHVPGCAAAIAGLFEDAPVPVVVHTPVQNEDVAALIQHPAVQAVSFTGSSRAGALVAATAASMIKPAVLELGGSDPAIVLADADLEKAAKTIALSRLINAGQSCIAAKRIIVEAQAHDAFVALLQAELEGYLVGNPAREDTHIGPLARQDIRDTLHRQIQASCAAGATCRMGGTLPAGTGFYYPVTLLTEVTNDMTVCREETFGPVAAVLKADTPDAALAIANDTPYGLAASLWTSRERGIPLLEQLQAGQVVLNGIVKTDPRLPSGGIKQSGYGRELGPHGIREFVNPCQVWIGS